MGIDVAAAGDHFVNEILALPLGRLNDPSDVANIALLLASDLSSQVTGSIHAVDAGAVVGLV